MSSLSEDRAAPLRVAKLVAIAREHLGLELTHTATRPDGAAGHDTAGRGAVLVEHADRRSLGPCLMWAIKQGLDEVTLVLAGTAPPASGTDATPLAEVAGWVTRQAAAFREPRVRVVTATSDGVQDVSALPAPLPTQPPSDATWELSAVLVEAGLDRVVEHGAIWGDVAGLGVACVTAGPDGAPRLELGVGRFDREIGLMLHGERPDVATIAVAADLVRRHRCPGAPVHPIRDLVPERWVRHSVLADPRLVGAAALEPTDSTLRPATLRERQPAAASGIDTDGRPLLVVASAGVDVDLVPHAADTRAAWHAGARLILVVPGALPATAVAVAGALIDPAEVVVVPPPWAG